MTWAQSKCQQRYYSSDHEKGEEKVVTQLLPQLHRLQSRYHKRYL